VTLVAYTTPREAYADIIPAFQATEAGAGAGVQFEESYGPPGDQSRAVEAGLPADVLALSLWPDVERLVEPGIVADDWDDNEYGGIVHNSVVALAVRPGNPKGITGWDDLIRKDVVVITPNPLTSGGAQWNILAAYQAQIDAGKTEQEAIAYLGQLAAQDAESSDPTGV
jgi:sulfate transport system substrate-binding protein